MRWPRRLAAPAPRCVTNAAVTSVEADGTRAAVTWLGGDGERSVDCSYVLANVAPTTLAALRGQPVGVTSPRVRS